MGKRRNQNRRATNVRPATNSAVAEVAASSRSPVTDLPAEAIASAIDPDLQAQLDRVDPSLRRRVEQRIAVQTTIRSAWLPPEILNQYAPEDRAMIMKAVAARTEAGIRREEQAFSRQQTRMDRGQWFGVTIAVLSVGAATVLGIAGNSWPTTVIAVFLAVAGIGGPSVARVIADRNYIQSRTLGTSGKEG